MAATTVTSGPDLLPDALVARPDQRQARVAMTPWRPVRPRSRRWEKKRLSSQEVQSPTRSTDTQPAARRARSAASCRSRFRADDDLGPEALAERPGHLVAHLVAAGADARPDRSGDRPVAERGDAGLGDPGEQAAPAGVQDGDRGRPVRTRERDREAVGREQHDAAARLVRPEAVAALELEPRCDDAAAVGLADVRAVVLPGHRRRLRVDAELRAEQTPVLADVLGVVVGEDAEVQRLEGAGADPAEPRGERHPVRAGSLPGEERHATVTILTMTCVVSSRTSPKTSQNWSLKTKMIAKRAIIPTWSS